MTLRVREPAVPVLDISIHLESVFLEHEISSGKSLPVSGISDSRHISHSLASRHAAYIDLVKKRIGIVREASLHMVSEDRAGPSLESQGS